MPTESYVPRHEFEKLRNRMPKIYAIGRKMDGWENKLNDIMDNQRLLRNEIRTLKKQIQRMKERNKRYG